jgi:hypothetical protein
MSWISLFFASILLKDEVKNLMLSYIHLLCPSDFLVKLIKYPLRSWKACADDFWGWIWMALTCKSRVRIGAIPVGGPMSSGVSVMSKLRAVAELGAVRRGVMGQLGYVSCVVRVGDGHTHTSHLRAGVLRMIPVRIEGRDGSLNGGSLVSFFNRTKDVSNGKRRSLFRTEGHNL